MWIIIILVVISLLIVVLPPNLQSLRSHKENSHGIVNYDPLMYEFCYRVDKTKEEIWGILDQYDFKVKYRFCATDGIITFYSELPDGFPEVSYQIQIIEDTETVIMKIKQINCYLGHNKYALLQNEFWHNKVGAIPIYYI